MVRLVQRGLGWAVYSGTVFLKAFVDKSEAQDYCRSLADDARWNAANRD